jgi:poly-beta-1,6-N-acetyl-D-glucosamine synthase
MLTLDPSRCRYLVVSPVKDEERYIETTMRSMVNQTVLPCLWIVVDDGSRDSTPEILKRYASEYDWIRVLRVERDSVRRPGWAEICAFAKGYEAAAKEDFDFVVKLDCDLDLPPDYFERLLTKFQEDESLGIASGIYLEKENDQWLPIIMPSYHASGASKVMRKKCFTDIGGFVLAPGWDTVDEIQALHKKWKTRHFEEIQFHHLKREGAGIGSLRTNRLHGEMYYVTGGGFAFFMLKVLHRMVQGKPFLVGGLAMFWGYFKCWISRRPRLVSDSEARFYRQMLNRRVWKNVARIFGRTKVRDEAWV